MTYKLLICDDERRIREGLRQAVDWESIGIGSIGIASDGEEGWQWIKDYHPELVITDIRMPKTNGLELLDKIMSTFPYTKVILLTGYGDFNYAQQALRSRAFDYIMKPTNPQTLIDTCKHALKEWEVHEKRSVLQAIAQSDTNTLVNRIVQYVHENYPNPISLESASKEIHVSTVHLNRMMKREIGFTFLEFLTQVRMAEAKLLLQQPKLTVQEVCYQVGYGDPKYFSQLFRKIVGCKPSEYTEENRSVL